MKKIVLILIALGLFSLSLYAVFLSGSSTVASAEVAAGVLKPAELSLLVYTGAQGQVALFFATALNGLMQLTGHQILWAIILLALLVELVLLYPSIRIQLKQKKIHLFHKKLVDRYRFGELSFNQTDDELHKLYAVNERLHSRGAWFVVVQAALFITVFWGLNLMVKAPMLLAGSWSVLNFNLLNAPSHALVPVLLSLLYFLHALAKIYFKQKEDYISPDQTVLGIGFALMASVVIYFFAGTFAMALSVYFATLITCSTIRYIVTEDHAKAWGALAQKELIEMLRQARPAQDPFEYLSHRWNHLPVVRYINFHLLEEAISMSLGLLLALNFFGVFQNADYTRALAFVPGAHAAIANDFNFGDPTACAASRWVNLMGPSSCALSGYTECQRKPANTDDIIDGVVYIGDDSSKNPPYTVFLYGSSVEISDFPSNCCVPSADCANVDTFRILTEADQCKSYLGGSKSCSVEYGVKINDCYGEPSFTIREPRTFHAEGGTTPYSWWRKPASPTGPFARILSCDGQATCSLTENTTDPQVLQLRDDDGGTFDCHYRAANPVMIGGPSIMFEGDTLNILVGDSITSTGDLMIVRSDVSDADLKLTKEGPGTLNFLLPVLKQYAAPSALLTGHQQVTFTVKDDGGLRGEDTHSLWVLDKVQLVCPSGATVKEGETLTGFNAGGGGALGLHFRLNPDIGTFNLTEYTAPLDAGGVTSVTLTVSDNDAHGAINSASCPITIGQADGIAFTNPPAFVIADSTTTIDFTGGVGTFTCTPSRSDGLPNPPFEGTCTVSGNTITYVAGTPTPGGTLSLTLSDTGGNSATLSFEIIGSVSISNCAKAKNNNGLGYTTVQGGNHTFDFNSSGDCGIDGCEWSVQALGTASGGTIDSNGLYTAPEGVTSGNAAIRMVRGDGLGAPDFCEFTFGSKQLTLRAADQPALLVGGNSVQLVPHGGPLPALVRWELQAGSMGALNVTTGVYTPAADAGAATATIHVRASDSVFPANVSEWLPIQYVNPVCRADFSLMDARGGDAAAYSAESALNRRGLRGREVYRFYPKNMVLPWAFDFIATDTDGIIGAIRKVDDDPDNPYIEVSLKDADLDGKAATLTLIDSVSESAGNDCRFDFTVTHQGPGSRPADSWNKTIGTTGN